MNKKIIAYVLIGLGILDLIIWAANGFTFGWLELIVGVNVLSKYGAWLMIFYGFWMFKKEKAKEQSEVDEMGYTQNDLAKIIGLKSRASEILNRKRPLTLEMIRNLHEKMNIPTHVLIQAY